MVSLGGLWYICTMGPDRVLPDNLPVVRQQLKDLYERRAKIKLLIRCLEQYRESRVKTSAPRRKSLVRGICG